MNTTPPLRAAASLRRRLLTWLLLPLLGLIALNAWWSYGRAAEVANDAYDRSLYVAARTLAEELHWVGGQLKLDVLRGAGYVFENHTGSRLFYRIDTPEGQWLAGNPALPQLPPTHQGAGVRYFSLVDFADASFRNEPVRLARLLHVIDGPPGPHSMVAITVVETREARETLVTQVLRETLLGQALLLVAAAVLVLVGVQRGIRPLEAFRQRLDLRKDDDFSAIELPGLPRELRPLIGTLNGYLARLGRLIDIRKRFLDNAAHQLRTPLTVLKTQLTLAQRSTDPTECQRLLAAADQTTNNAVQLTQQLLALTRAEHASEIYPRQTLDLVALAREVTQERLLDAHRQGADLGFETQVTHCHMEGVPIFLHEALANLIDNALRHGGPGVQVTVRVGNLWVEVQDNGPGIAPAHQAHVFERFYSHPTAPQATKGSGLGLAIVREIALQHKARLRLSSPVEQGRGVCIRLVFAPGP